MLLSVCGKYKDLCCNCSRTLLIGPVPEQREAYSFLLEVFEVLQKTIKPGSKISDVYKACVSYGNDKAKAEGGSNTETGKKF